MFFCFIVISECCRQESVVSLFYRAPILEDCQFLEITTNTTAKTNNLKQHLA